MAIEVYYSTNTQVDKHTNTPRWIQYGDALPGSNYTWIVFMLFMERKYLPSLPSPSPLEEYSPSYHSRFSVSALNDEERLKYIQEIWDLQTSDLITSKERIVMLSMMDKAYFKLEHSTEIFDAWTSVAKNLHPQSQAAFGQLIIVCLDLINSRNVENILINWNSVLSIQEYMTDEHFDCVAEAMDIEDKIDVDYLRQLLYT